MQLQRIGEAKRLLIIQLIFFLLIPVALLPFGKTVVLSGFLGGLIAVTSTAMTMIMVFRQYTAQQPEKIVARLYGAQLSKMMFAIAAFALIMINVEPLSFATLLLVYFFIQVVPAIVMNYR